MNNSQIEILMAPFNRYKTFKGCFSSDNIQQLEPNSVTIYNTESGYPDFGHWVALFTSSQLNSNDNVCLYFDSLGNIPQNLRLVEQVLTYSKNFNYSNVQYQSVFSQLCGLHVVYVSSLFCQGVSIEDILCKYYNSNTNKELINDQIVFYALLPELKKLDGGKDISQFTLTLPFFSPSENGF